MLPRRSSRTVMRRRVSPRLAPSNHLGKFATADSRPCLGETPLLGGRTLIQKKKRPVRLTAKQAPHRPGISLGARFARTRAMTF